MRTILKTSYFSILSSAADFDLLLSYTVLSADVKNSLVAVASLSLATPLAQNLVKVCVLKFWIQHFASHVEFILVIHLELIRFRIITGLASLRVGVSSEAPCVDVPTPVIHQAKPSLQLSPLNLQLWKTNNVESRTLELCIVSNLLKVCYII